MHEHHQCPTCHASGELETALLQRKLPVIQASANTSEVVFAILICVGLCTIIGVGIFVYSFTSNSRKGTKENVEGTNQSILNQTIKKDQKKFRRLFRSDLCMLEDKSLIY